MYTTVVKSRKRAQGISRKTTLKGEKRIAVLERSCACTRTRVPRTCKACGAVLRSCLSPPSLHVIAFWEGRTLSLYRMCSLQNVFCIECVLYRMCACVRCADCILGGAHPHHIYSILCPTESCRQNAFCTECVLYRMCSVQNVIAFWEGRTHTIFIHCCVPQRASTECVLYRTLYVCARHTIFIHCCVPQRAAGGNALRQ